MTKIDCVIVGFNDYSFSETVDLIRGDDETSGAYRDVNLAFVNMDGEELRALDVLNKVNGENTDYKNTGFLWPVVLYLGNFLHKRGFSFDYVNLFQEDKAKLRDLLENNEVLSVALTTTLYVSPQPLLEMIEFIREIDPNVKIIVGGPYVSSQAQMMDDRSLCDQFAYLGGDIYVISSEGEDALVQTLSALKKEGSLQGIENIAYREGDQFVLNTQSVERNELEENLIDYTLFPQEEYGEFLSLRTAKSCPFNCAFCGFPERAGKYTYFNMEKIEQELDAVAKIGSISTLTFLDDTFNVPKKRFREIMQLMIDKKYGFKWNSFYRSDHGDEKTIDLMKRAGCEGVFLGVESGSDTILQKMNKKSRRSDYLKAIKQFKELEILTYSSLIIGFPGETDETVEESISFLNESESDFYRSQLWYCDPITPIWERREELGIQDFAFNWRHNTMDCKQASDHVERMFLNVQSSIWLPQHGFELWSLFFLQRQGYPVSQIKNYLRAFNDGIREKLLYPEQREISEQVKKNLFHWGRNPKHGAVEHLPEFAPLHDPVETVGCAFAGNLAGSGDENEEFSF